jgi:hypothetical protein
MAAEKLDGLNGLNGVAALVTEMEPEPLLEPELITEEETRSSVCTLDDLAREEDDADLVVGDNPLKQIEVRKPRQQEFFQTHPKWVLDTRAVIAKHGARDVVYLLHKKLMPWSETLLEDSKPVSVRVCMSYQGKLPGKLFVWVFKRLLRDGVPARTYQDTMDHVRESRTHWVRHFWLESEGRFQMRIGQMKELPAWPEDITFQQVMTAAFGDRIIVDENSPILRELRGEL